MSPFPSKEAPWTLVPKPRWHQAAQPSTAQASAEFKRLRASPVQVRLNPESSPHSCHLSPSTGPVPPPITSLSHHPRLAPPSSLGLRRHLAPILTQPSHPHTAPPSSLSPPIITGLSLKAARIVADDAQRCPKGSSGHFRNRCWCVLFRNEIDFVKEKRPASFPTMPRRILGPF